MNSQIVVTGLTVLVSVVWLATFVLRVSNHPFEGSAAVDTAMLLMLGFWFGNKALKGDGSKPPEKAATT